MYTVRVEKRHTENTYYTSCDNCGLAIALKELGFKKTQVMGDVIISGKKYKVLNKWDATKWDGTYKGFDVMWHSVTFEKVNKGILPYFDVIIDMPAPEPIHTDITKSLAVLPIEETSDLIIDLVSNI